MQSSGAKSPRLLGYQHPPAPNQRCAPARVRPSPPRAHATPARRADPPLLLLLPDPSRVRLSLAQRRELQRAPSEMQQLHLLPYSLLGGGLSLVPDPSSAGGPLFLLQSAPQQQGLGGLSLAGLAGGGGGLPLELLVKSVGPGGLQQLVVLPPPAQQPSQPILSVLPLDAALHQQPAALPAPAAHLALPPREPAPQAVAQGKRPRPTTPDTYHGPSGHAARPLAHPSGSRWVARTASLRKRGMLWGRK